MSEATRPAPKLSVISRALRRAIAFCLRMEEQTRGVHSEHAPGVADAWKREATVYQTLLDKLEPKQKKAAKPA
jgi:hypothetical protein